MGGHWIGGELLLFDTETDSPEPDDAHLIQSAIIHVRPGQERRQWKWLCRPDRPIPPGATAVHGISTEQATADGQPRADVLDEMMAVLSDWRPGVPLLGHNIVFDLTVLDRNLGRELGTELRITGPVVDTLLVDKCADKWRPGERTLTTQCEHYKIKLTAAHDAFADALAAGHLAWRLATCKSWPRGRYGPSADEREARAVLASGDLAVLHDAQVRWFEVTQLGLADYFETPKALAKIEEKVAAGKLTREAADERIANLPTDVERIRATARGGWPLLPRVPVTT
ncbi:MAG TPA: exonuclease domain-containing protein [Pseudonocardiaceae bacterium]|nr:exonuclease domain-containing protein [Pseudonocardiaceae bacterium]